MGALVVCGTLGLSALLLLYIDSRNGSISRFIEALFND